MAPVVVTVLIESPTNESKNGMSNALVPDPALAIIAGPRLTVSRVCPSLRTVRVIGPKLDGFEAIILKMNRVSPILGVMVSN